MKTAMFDLVDYSAPTSPKIMLPIVQDAVSSSEVVAVADQLNTPRLTLSYSGRKKCERLSSTASVWVTVATWWTPWNRTC